MPCKRVLRGVFGTAKSRRSVTRLLIRFLLWLVVLEFLRRKRGGVGGGWRNGDEGLCREEFEPRGPWGRTAAVGESCVSEILLSWVGGQKDACAHKSVATGTCVGVRREARRSVCADRGQCRRESAGPSDSRDLGRGSGWSDVLRFPPTGRRWGRGHGQAEKSCVR